ncbi:MAG: hypothetical protein ABF443_07715 [Acetobacter malorum]
MPTQTRMIELSPTGTSGNRRAAAGPAEEGWSRTAVKAAAPPGGWSERVAVITMMASPTASPAASI